MSLVLRDFRHIGAAIGSNEAQSGSPILDQFIEHLGQYICIKAANVDLQVVHHL